MSLNGMTVDEMTSYHHEVNAQIVKKPSQKLIWEDCIMKYLMTLATKGFSLAGLQRQFCSKLGCFNRLCFSIYIFERYSFLE
jgi:hypothetical protein